MKPSISIRVEGDLDNLPPEAVWPDGDAPAKITAAAVAARIAESRNVEDWLTEWMVGDILDVTVTVTVDNPAWAGEDTLPGMPPVARQLTTVAHPFRQPVTVREVTA